ncbi:hypothetical protein [Sulfitobacter sp.]|uniref:hypothetical protein n=1 Tax=Sulfitobacter sp. TaxID=1903071 RepID=UPI003001E0E1
MIMRTFGFFALTVALVCATPLQAQPVSWGMAQCSALMDVMEDHVSGQPQKGYLAHAAEAMFVAAETQSRVDGRNPDELTRVHADKHDDWVAMGYTMAFKAEFRDWIDFCRSLARSYDVPLDASMLH